MDKIARIRREVERLKDENNNIRCNSNKAYCQGYDDAFVDLLPFLDTLSEQSSKSLEEAARLEEEIAKYFSGWKNDSEYGQAIIVETSQCVSVEDCKDIARYFYQLGIYPKMPKDFVAARDYANYKESHSLNAYIAFDEGFTKGVKWDQEQMLADAVEGEAEELYNDGESQCVVSVGTYFEPGDKVYVLKAEEE